MRPATCALERVAEAELVEHVAGDARVVVRIEQPLNGPGASPGAVELLAAGLHAERRGELREAQVERHELHLDAAFLLLVGEGLLDAVVESGRFVEPELVVLVVGGAEPEADRVDAAGLRAEFAFAGDLGLLRVDARVGGRRRRCRGCDRALLYCETATPTKPLSKIYEPPTDCAVGARRPNSAAGR